MSEHFEKSNYFCCVCGNLLPPLLSVNIQCRRCSMGDRRKAKKCEQKETRHCYNKIPMKSDENAKEGSSLPVTQRQCRRCGNGEMYYLTQQTRSADEGQTVFYTCTECGFKDLEYS